MMLDVDMDGALVVLVDDDWARGELFRDWLCGEGYQVEQFLDGEACLRALSQPFPDAVFLNLDAVSPDSTRLLHAFHHRMPRVPLIVRTARASSFVQVPCSWQSSSQSGDSDRGEAAEPASEPTAVSDQDVWRQVLRLGAYDFLSDPILRLRLLTTMAHAVTAKFMNARIAFLERQLGIEPRSDGPESVEPVSTLQEVEQRAIATALEACHGNLSEVARQLGIGRTTLYRKIEKYRIRRE